MQPIAQTFDLKQPSNSGRRIVSLDVYRGLTVAGMILVTDPGTYSAVYPQLMHAVWRGATLTDMIFPSFLFIVGVSIVVALRHRLSRAQPRSSLVLHVLRRSAVLILLGLFLNAFPAFHLATLRIPGILQRIAICYLAAALVFIACGTLGLKRRILAYSALIAGLVGGYWLLLTVVPVPGYGAGHLDTLRSLPAYVDRAVFTVPHLWPYGLTPGVGVTFDSEGLLSTLPAIATVLVGVLSGELLLSAISSSRKLAVYCIAGVLLIMCGVAAGPIMPIIKKLWTPSFMFLSSGFSLLAFALLYWVVDLRRLRRGLTPALIFGTKSIFAFSLSTVITSLLQFHTRGVAWHTWAYTHLFLPWLAPVHASLAYALAIVALNCGLTWLLYRRRVFLKL